jgi:hypothetical protein
VQLSRLCLSFFLVDRGQRKLVVKRSLSNDVDARQVSYRGLSFSMVCGVECRSLAGVLKGFKSLKHN